MTIQIRNIALKEPIDLLDTCHLEFEKGTINAITGANGSGKTTLLYSLGLLDDNHFEYDFNGYQIDLKNSEQRAYYRRYKIGYVFQDYLMLQGKNIQETFETMFDLVGKVSTLQQIQHLLALVRLDISLEKSVDQLSGGQKQRLALALTLVKEPELLLLDEPTSHLDKQNQIHLMEILKELVQKRQMIVVLVTHFKEILALCDKVYEIKDHHIESVFHSIQEKKRLSIQKLSFAFYVRYLYRRFKSHYLFFALLTLFSSFTIGFVLLTFNLKDGYIQYQDDLYNSILSKEIYVQNNEIISDEQIHSLMSYSDIESVNYFHQTLIQIGDQYYSVVSLHDKQRLKQHEVTSVSSTGIYISEDLYRKLNYPKSLSLLIEDQEILLPIQATYDLSYQDSFLKITDCIYVDPTYFTLPSNQLMIQVKDIKTIRNVINQLDFPVIKSIAYDLYQSDQDMQLTARIGMLFSIVIFVISFSFFTVVLVKQNEERKLEYTLLKVNGLTNTNISCLMLLESLIIIVSLIVLTVVWYEVDCLFIQWWMSIHLKFNLGWLLGEIVLVSMISMMFPTLISIFKMRKESIVDVLRK